MRAPARRWLRRLAWAALATAALLVLLRSTVATLYHVDSASMEPALGGGGEYVLVRYGRPRELRRFDVVVVRRPDDARPLVKRVVGLPGEEIQVRAGDVIVDGRRLAPEVPRPAPVLLFDERHDDLEAFFVLDRGPEGPWSRSGDVWRLDARAVPPGADRGLMCSRERLRDGYRDARGERVPGRQTIGDAVVECELRALEPGGRVRLRLVEAWDTFQAFLDVPESGGSARVALTARLVRGGPVELVAADVPFELGAWRHVRFANVDDHLSLSLDGRVVLESPAESSGAVPGSEVPPGAAACLGGEGLVAEFRAVRVLRDLHYTSRGSFGVDAPVHLGPDEVFLLGDNSTESRDSRQWGPVRLADVVGRPIAVVWPPSRVRRLAAP